MHSENFQKALTGEAYQTINTSLDVTPDQNMVTGSIHGNEDMYMLIKNGAENTTSVNIFFMIGF